MLTFTDREGTHGIERVYRCTRCPSERGYFIGEEPTAARLALVASFAAYAHRVHACEAWNRWFSVREALAGIGR